MALYTLSHHIDINSLDQAVGFDPDTCEQDRWFFLRYSRKALSGLTYELEGSAGPFASARSRWSTVEREDGATELSVEGTFIPHGWFSRYVVWPVAKPMITRLTKQVMLELERYVAARGTTACD